MYAGYIVETATTARPVRDPIAPVHDRAAPLDPARRRGRRRAAHPDRGPAAGHAPGADLLPVRGALPLAARDLLGGEPAAATDRRGRRAVVMTGPEATHQIACFNPPTPEEAVAGKPLRDGFVAAPPPAGILDEVGAGRLGSTADLEGDRRRHPGRGGTDLARPVGRRAAAPTRGRAPWRTEHLP